MSFDQGQRRRVYPLRFRDFGGLVVQTRKPGWSAFRQLTSAVLVLGDDLDGWGLPASGKLDAWDDLFTAFADSVVSWDLTDRGRAVPATKRHVLAQDFEFLMALARTWYTVVVQHTEKAAPVEDALPHDDPQPVDNTGPQVDEEWLSQFRTFPIPDDLRSPESEPAAVA